MAIVVDKSKTNTNKSADNKQRFIKRHQKKIKEAVKDRFNHGKLNDIQSGDGLDVWIDGATTEEYQFVPDPSTGDKRVVAPGNAGVYNGEEFPKPQSGGGNGGKGEAGDGDDFEEDYIFHLNEEEFRNILFEYLELPDFIKKSLKNSENFKLQQAGFSKNGIPAQLSLIKSYLNSYARRLVIEEDLDEQIKNAKTKKERDALIAEKDALTLFEEEDLRYKHWDKKVIKINSAVMFCVMDVSGSMFEELKQRAKKFFYLLYLFLKHKYTNFEIRFLAHTTDAQEVSEKEFFFGKRSGGTKILPAYQLMNDIIARDYPSDQWNIYVAQASDGDCFGDDIKQSSTYLSSTILPLVQYAAYLEVRSSGYGASSEGSDYIKELRRSIHDKKLQTRIAAYDSQIFDIFIELFKKKGA